MDNYHLFKVFFYRKYPQIAKSVDSLVHIFTELNKHELEFEIEAQFGKLFYTENSTAPNFNDELSEYYAQNILKTLESYSKFEVKDWTLSYKYFVDDDKDKVIEINYEDSCSIQCYSPRVIAHKTFSYLNLQDGQFNYLTKVNFCQYEQLDTNNVDFIQFQSIHMVYKKSFIISSLVNSKSKWQFDVIQYYEGSDISCLEKQILNKQIAPKFTFQCKLLKNSEPFTLSEKEKFFIFSSLLLKMQDFLDCQAFARAVNDKEENTLLFENLPSFRIVSF